MYVHQETGKPAWLVSQDADGVTYSDGDRRRRSCASHEFFGAHREATADELRDHGRQPRGEAAGGAAKPKAPAKAARKPKNAARKPPAVSQAMQQGATAKPAPVPSAAASAPKPTVTVEPLK